MEWISAFEKPMKRDGTMYLVLTRGGKVRLLRIYSEHDDVVAYCKIPPIPEGIIEKAVADAASRIMRQVEFTEEKLNNESVADMVDEMESIVNYMRRLEKQKNIINEWEY